MISDYQFFLFVTPDCRICPPYKERLSSWKIPFMEIDGSTPEGNSFRKSRKIMGAPNLVVMEGGRFVGCIQGAVSREQDLHEQLKKIGVRI